LLMFAAFERTCAKPSPPAALSGYPPSFCSVGCHRLYSEDLNPGQTYHGVLIVNLFETRSSAVKDFPIVRAFRVLAGTPVHQ
jgi:hypothetical protein